MLTSLFKYLGFVQVSPMSDGSIDEMAAEAYQRLLYRERQADAIAQASSVPYDTDPYRRVVDTLRADWADLLSGVRPSLGDWEAVYEELTRLVLCNGAGGHTLLSLTDNSYPEA